MKVLIDAKCSNGHVNEYFVENVTKEVPCKDCQLQAQRMVSPVRSVLEPFSGGFAGATLKWARDHERKAQQATR